MQTTLIAFANNGPAPPHYTGIVCNRCRAPIAVLIEHTPRTVALQCPECGHSWSDAPAVTLGAASARLV